MWWHNILIQIGKGFCPVSQVGKLFEVPIIKAYILAEIVFSQLIMFSNS